VEVLPKKPKTASSSTQGASSAAATPPWQGSASFAPPQPPAQPPLPFLKDLFKQQLLGDVNGTLKEIVDRAYTEVGLGEPIEGQTLHERACKVWEALGRPMDP